MYFKLLCLDVLLNLKVIFHSYIFLHTEKKRHNLHERGNFIQKSSSQYTLPNFIKTEEKMCLNVFSHFLLYWFYSSSIQSHIKMGQCPLTFIIWEQTISNPLVLWGLAARFQPRSNTIGIKKMHVLSYSFYHGNKGPPLSAGDAEHCHN
jgi:hypothetical protein